MAKLFLDKGRYLLIRIVTLPIEGVSIKKDHIMVSV